MEPFATLLDLKARGTCPPDEGVAQALLSDASALLRAELPTIDDRIDEGKLDPSLPRMVVCQMVARAIGTSDAALGMTQVQTTTGPFSGGFTVSNPGNRLWLSKADRRLLGIGRQRAFMVDPTPPVAS